MDKQIEREKYFNGFLNKTILFAANDYFRKKNKTELREIECLDNESIELFNLISEDDLLSEPKDVNDFIELIENPLLISALKSLSNIEMTVIFLMFEKQLSNKEISILLKMYTSCVARIKTRALKKIAKYLKEEM